MKATIRFTSEVGDGYLDTADVLEALRLMGVLLAVSRNVETIDVTFSTNENPAVVALTCNDFGMRLVEIVE